MIGAVLTIAIRVLLIALLPLGAIGIYQAWPRREYQQGPIALYLVAGYMAFVFLMVWR